MKKFAAALCLGLGWSFSAMAQLITTSPAFPVSDAPFSITVDCSFGNKGLLNYASTSDVYVHIGVITDQSAGQWKYTPFIWATTPAAAKAVYLGNNRYQYNIANARSFFGVPAGEKILKVAILFRNGSGSFVQRNADGSDMFIPIYSSSLAGKFTRPFFQPLFTPAPENITLETGDSIWVRYQTNQTADQIKLYVNGSLKKSVNTDTLLADSFKIASGGNQEYIAQASVGASTVSDTLRFFVPPPTVIAALPAGVRDGINYESGDTSAILVLYAPEKKRAAVIGEFNSWKETNSNQMMQTPGGKRFWYRLTGLTPGYEYAYQYLVEGVLRIADPYSEKILDPDNDPYIPAVTYPNLKSYPTGSTSGIVGILQTQAPVYQWQSTGYSRPDAKSMVVYEMLLRDFLAAHNWKTLKDTLSYFKSLGINTIELMPVNEFEGNISWGYNPSFYFAPDKYYGPAADMKAFVDACHQQGIAVVMDIALNHSFGQSPLVQLYFDAANNRPAANNPWFNPVPKHAYNVGYDMNHESAATHYFFGRVVAYWLNEFHIDGFRFDLSKGFTQKATCDANGGNCNVNAWSAYDASRVAIWKGYYDTVQAHEPGSYVILEHFADSTEEKQLSDYGMMLWGNGNYEFNEASMGYLGSSNFGRTLYTSRGFTEPRLMSYMESHDEERLMYKNETYGNSSGGYNVKDLNTGLKRNEMAASFFFMMPGPKMIWQFGELGYDYSINYCQNGSINASCRVDPKPIRWDYRQNASRARLREVYAALLQLRAHPLYRADFSKGSIKSNLSGAIKWLSVATDTSDLVVLGNFDVSATSATVTFPQGGTWYDYFTGQTITATGAAQAISLQPGEYHIYLNRNITHELTPVTDVIYNGRHLRLSTWPNPVTGPLNLQFEVPEAGRVTLCLRNLAGQQLAVLYNAVAAPGLHQLPAVALGGNRKLATGLYLLEMNFGNRRLIQKLIIQ